MKKIKFSKMVASGNDFIVAEVCAKDSSLRSLAQNICDRKFGIGADGLLILEKSQVADIRMRIFNADGSEAQMCANGARCTALYTGRKNTKIETIVFFILYLLLDNISIIPFLYGPTRSHSLFVLS